MLHTGGATNASSGNKLDFLWLELTNVCNLNCVHCYAESGPTAGSFDVLTFDDYSTLINEAYEIGCRKVQFIGGEPTLSQDLTELIKLARKLNYEYIEVFTNLFRLTDDLVDCIEKNNVRVATSIYAPDSEHHDAITLRKGSFDRTMKNVERLRRAGVPVRVGVIEMQQNKGLTKSTINFLKGKGIENVNSDHVREFGRANDGSKDIEINSLCGTCAGGTLRVGPDGQVSPCIMSPEWSVGSVLDSSLANIVSSRKLSEVRQRIFDEVIIPQKERSQGALEDSCLPCNPGDSCSPCPPNVHCAPNSCPPWTGPPGIEETETEVALS